MDYDRITRNAYLTLVTGVVYLEAHGEPVPPGIDKTLNKLERLRDTKTGERIIGEPEKAWRRLCKDARQTSGEPRGEAIGGLGRLPYKKVKPTVH